MADSKRSSQALIGVAVICGLIIPIAAQADEAPLRKPGLWEVKTTLGGSAHVLTVQQCIDAATDLLLQSSTGPFSADLCDAREVKKSQGSMTIDSHCKIGNKAATAHAVVTGSFDQAYSMTVESDGGDLPKAKLTINGKWLGPCAAGQAPGDVMMGNGTKVNILALQKRAPMQSDPLNPAK